MTMNKTEYDKKTLIKYLVWSFVLGYIVQFVAKLLIDKDNLTVAKLVMSGLMFTPTLSVLFSGAKFKNMGF